MGSKYGNIDVSKLAEHVKELRDEMKQKIKEKVEEVKDKAANRPPGSNLGYLFEPGINRI